MKRTVVTFLVIFLSSVALVQASPVREAVLDNGMRVLINEMPLSPVAAINLCVKTGAANEGKFAGSGISHMLEHMLFKGTSRRGAGVIPQEARAMGGYINASTGHDSTDYILSVPKENFSQALDLLADMLTDPVVNAVEFEREREVIIKEMNLVNDNPDRKMNDLVYQVAYNVHPYQHRIIGREDILRSLSREDILEYYHAWYVPNNMIISIAGGVRADDILPLLQERFKDFKARPFPLRNLPQEPEQIFQRHLEVEYPTDLMRLVMAYQSVPLLHEDLYALDVLAMALGHGASSRFYVELYKKRHLVESVGAGNYTPQDKGLFEITCLLKGREANDVVEAVRTMIRQVQKHGLKTRELEKVKRQVMADDVYSRQTAEGMAGKLAAETAFTGDVHFSSRYLDGVRAVTNEDIIRVARRYLVDRRLNVIILKPIKEKKDSAPSDSSLGEKTFEKVILPNGLTLLLKEDHGLPIIVVSAVFNGGMRDETLALNGLAALTGSVWAKGLPGKNAEQISHETDARAASLGGAGGRNTFVFTLSGLKEDQAFLFDSLEAFLTKPSFPESEIQRDKEQMLTALMRRKDSVLEYSSRELVQGLFEYHPFRWDSLGTEKSLSTIKRNDLLATFERCVRSDNGVVVIAGDMDAAAVRAELEQRLAGLKRGKPEFKTTDEPMPGVMRFKELTMDKEQAVVLFGFRGPFIKDADRYAAEVLVNIMGSSLGGRLFKRIRDEFGKSYTVSGGFSPAIDAGMITFFALTSNEGIDKVRAIMQEEFLRIQHFLVGEQELTDAKVYLKSRLARDMQTIGAQAMTRAVDELLGLGYDHVDNYPARIDAVSAEDVRALAQKYLDVNRASVVITRTSEKTGK